MDSHRIHGFDASRNSVTNRRHLLGGALVAALARHVTPPDLTTEPGATRIRGARQPVGRAAAAAATRPNVILMVLDDLDARMVAQMPALQRLVGEHGVTFSNFFVTSPLCGPSRASLLRGQYAHNHGMLANTGEAGGFSTFHRLGREASHCRYVVAGRGLSHRLGRQVPQRLPQRCRSAIHPTRLG